MHEIFREGSNGPLNKRLNFGGDSDDRLDTVIVFRIHHYWVIAYGKWLTDINLLLILIRWMAALVKRALAEVCTVPVLLVIIIRPINVIVIIITYHCIGSGKALGWMRVSVCYYYY